MTLVLPQISLLEQLTEFKFFFSYLSFWNSILFVRSAKNLSDSETMISPGSEHFGTYCSLTFQRANEIHRAVQHQVSKSEFFSITLLENSLIKEAIRYFICSTSNANSKKQLTIFEIKQQRTFACQGCGKRMLFFFSLYLRNTSSHPQECSSLHNRKRIRLNRLFMRNSRCLNPKKSFRLTKQTLIFQSPKFLIKLKIFNLTIMG